MTVSVIIPHYGSDDLLATCVDALDAHAPDAEIVIWDGNEDNQGFAGNCNGAAKRASGDLLVFLNNDCTIHPGWLAPLVEACTHHPIAGSHLVYPDGGTQHAGVTVIRYPHGAVEGRNIQTARQSCEVDAVTGASLAIPADTFWAVGGFDEAYWNGYEDVDLCLAVTELTGRRAWWCADSVATHLESVSGPERWVKVRENEHRLSAKWGSHV